VVQPGAHQLAADGFLRLRDLVARLGTGLRHPDQHLPIVGGAVGLNQRLVEAVGKRVADLRDGRLLIELRHDRGAARELDAEGDTLRQDDAEAGQDDHPRHGDCVPAPAEEVEIAVLEDMHG
jgi:hypothetical protein